MKRLIAMLVVLLCGVAWAQPPANTKVWVPDDYDVTWGSDGDFRARYDEATDNRLELSDGTNLMLTLADVGTTVEAIINGTLELEGALTLDDTSLKITEGADTLTLTVPALTAARAVTLPDAAGEISLLGQTISIAEISATGTPSSTTFLRGDGIWSAGGGDVTGPASSTANTFPVFADGSGKLLTTSTFSLTNTARLDEAETILANWANTANPWADNEVSDTLTIGASSTVNDAALSANVSLLGSSISLTSEVTGNLPVGNLNSGTDASASTFWRGDGAWATPAGGGDVAGPGTTVVSGNVVSWNGTTGTLVQDSGVAAANLADLSAAETIAGNWVNTANPWADNEVADTLTIGASSTVADGALSANVSLLGGQIDYSEMDFTGTASADTYARGDGAWATPPVFIELMAASGKPCTTSGASEPAADANDNWSIAMDTGEYAFWEIVIPSNFDDGVDSINFYWWQSTSTGAVTWKIQAITLVDTTAMNTAWSTDTSASADTASDVDELQVTSLSASSLLGSGTGNRIAKIRIGCTYASGGVVHFAGCYLEY